MSCKSEQIGNVVLVDPNCVNYDGNVVNGVPDYQDMYISVGLRATRRGRTVLETSSETRETGLRKDAGYDSDINISFLGENQDVNSNAYNNKFTTNWYEGSANVDNTYEGFGITDIKIVTNSSYIPQINIEFVDIKGLAFFNRENSPYRILYDFPPPIFHLTVKGYYGKALTYKMHLVKHNTEFKAETGNFHISCEFVAITYAPLSDVLFRYLLQAPFLDDNRDNSSSSDPSKKPTNTWDLILKLENLYSELPKLLKTDSDSKKYELTQKKLGKFNNVMEVLYNYFENETLKEGGEPMLAMYDEDLDSENYGERNDIDDFTPYGSYIESFGEEEIPSVIEKRLYLGYAVNKDDSNVIIPTTNSKNDLLISQLKKYRSYLLKITKESVSVINDVDIIEPIVKSDLRGALSENDSPSTGFVGIDITNYYVKLIKERKIIINDKVNAMEDLNLKINNTIQTNLGMLPTIYNVFEIIMNDVDKFFTSLKSISVAAEEHHNDTSNKSLIINNGTYKDVEDSKIFPFPLVVKSSTVCGQTKEERIAPIELSASLKNAFPELILVQNFIDSFIKSKREYEQATMRLNTNSQGDYKWIPFMPSDSKLVTNNLKSPYYGMDSAGGSSNQQPINPTNYDKLSDVFRVVLQRFYALSQNALAYTFYSIDDDEYKSDSTISSTYIELFAKSEGINLANSITNEEYGLLMISFVESIINAKETDGFYEFLETNLSDWYSNDNRESLSLSNGIELYRDKSENKFDGFKFISEKEISTRMGSEDNDDFDDFIKSNTRNWFDNHFRNKPDIPEESMLFTKENVILRKDVLDGEDSKYETKFLLRPLLIKKETQPFEVLKIYRHEGGGFVSAKYPEIIEDASTKGNLFFRDNNYNAQDEKDIRNLNSSNVIDIWSETLGDYDTEMKGLLTDPNSNKDLNAVVYLSNFGYTLSPFNYYPHNLNRTFFRVPSIVELPRFVKLYMGSLVGISKGDGRWNDIYNFFTVGEGKNIPNGGILIFSDIHDINEYLSEKDKDDLKLEYDDWLTNYYSDYGSSISDLYSTINDLTLEINDVEYDYNEKCFSEDAKEKYDKLNSDEERLVYLNKKNSSLNQCKVNAYSDALNPGTGTERFLRIIGDYIERYGIVIYSEITFNYDKTISPATYTSLKTSNDTRRDVNDKYFNFFFREVRDRLKDRVSKLERETEDFKLSTGDEDIVTQTYYSFKNINDKWVSGLDKSIEGYPFKSEDVDELIGQFAFVDRAMKPIGDTIIDPQILIDSMNNPEATVFSVISQLLSLNNFEFFPLQNFLSFKEDEWEESFKINTGSPQRQHPVFVCMYIGGTSSYPTGIGKFGGQFMDDGIIDLRDPGVKDFSLGNCDELDEEKDAQLTKLPNDGNILNKVRAFRVRYGEQNQSMFNGFAVDSKEFQETNESIQILSQLAGDNRQSAPVAKAQNLYNIYENRSYRATISGYGNAMIQPTQYFQLENVPLFDGAYIIISVDHTITANKMTTSFSGMKILKYPVPRVTNPAALVGFEGGNTSETDSSQAKSAGAANSGVVLGTGTAGNPNQTKYNSMYNLEIS